jgi:hypothetical protein
MVCLACELNPIVHFNGRGLCSEHSDQWIAVETRHAPLLSGPMSVEERRIGSRQQGVTSHKPRHY